MKTILSFLEDWWAGILAIALLILEVIRDMPELDSFSWPIILFFLFIFIQAFKPQLELNQIKNARPRLMVGKPPYVDKRLVLVYKGDILHTRPVDYIGGTTQRLVPVRTTTETVGANTIYQTYFEDKENDKVEEYYFAHIPYINKPKVSTEQGFARDVWAEISFYDTEKNPIWERVNGRWSETEQPSNLPPNQSRRDLLEVDFPPNGRPWELDIAMKSPKEKNGFVFNNDSYEFIEFRRGDMILKEGTYLVKVILRGTGIKSDGEEFNYILSIDSETGEMSIEERTGKSRRRRKKALPDKERLLQDTPQGHEAKTD